MKNSLILLFFLICMVLIFIVNSYMLLGILLLINFIWLLFLKVGFLKILKYNLYILPIVLFTWLFNFWLTDKSFAMLLSLRLVLACNVTFTLSKIFTLLELGRAIEGLFLPLKVFRVNTYEVGMIITISISILPILKKDITDTYYALKARGVRLKMNNGIYFVKPILISILKRTDEMEKALIAKGVNN